jgi:prepilin-type N-terminal cleavage/methylation domain-containing protein/prepilin-type processing-associated H-X9-DG protein
MKALFLLERFDRSTGCRSLFLPQLLCLGADSGEVMWKESGLSPRRFSTMPRLTITRSAFTLVEVLIVIAIILILGALAVPALSSVRERAAIAQSSQNLRQLGLLTQQYAADNNGYLPVRDFGPNVNLNWTYALYPLAYNKPFPSFMPFETGINLKGTIFHSPVMKSEEGSPLRSYGINGYLAADSLVINLLPDNRMKLVSIVRPTATVLFGDSRNKSDLSAGQPNTVGKPQFRNNGRALLCFVDGHVELRLPSEVPTNRTDVFWSGK